MRSTSVFDVAGYHLFLDSLYFSNKPRCKSAQVFSFEDFQPFLKHQMKRFFQTWGNCVFYMIFVRPYCDNGVIWIRSLIAEGVWLNKYLVACAFSTRITFLKTQEIDCDQNTHKYYKNFKKCASFYVKVSLSLIFVSFTHIIWHFCTYNAILARVTFIVILLSNELITSFFNSMRCIFLEFFIGAKTC